MFWIDRNVPEKYRAAVRDGILEWNKAFEKIGFKDAIVVKQQDADAHVRHLRRAPLDGALVRCHRCGLRDRPVDRRPAHRRDPRCPGRDSRVVVARATARSSPSRRRRRGRRSTRTRRRSGSTAAAARTRPMRSPRCSSVSTCCFERGDIEPGSPEADAFVSASLKAVVMHEVGHTLGLRHNFRGVDRVSAREDLGSDVQPRARHLGLGDGLQPAQHRREGRAAGRLLRADDRPLRLLGDRVRVPAAAEGDRNRRAREDRRARRDRSAARVLVRRGGDRRASTPTRASSTSAPIRSSTCRSGS